MCGSELIEQRATNDAAPGTEHTSAKESKEVGGEGWLVDAGRRGEGGRGGLLRLEAAVREVEEILNWGLRLQPPRYDHLAIL